MIKHLRYTQDLETSGYRSTYGITKISLLGIPIYQKRELVNEEAAPIDAKLRSQVYNSDFWQCVYCGAQDEKKFHCDHVSPKSRGGATSLENLVTSCAACNHRKHAFTPNEACLTLKYGRFYQPSCGQADDLAFELANYKHCSIEALVLYLRYKRHCNSAIAWAMTNLYGNGSYSGPDLGAKIHKSITEYSKVKCFCSMFDGLTNYNCVLNGS